MADINTIDAEQFVADQREEKVYRSKKGGIRKQSWAGIYRDYRDVNKHVVLEDMLYGIGGVSGFGISMNQNVLNAYSYITPLSTELQYVDRVRNGDYTNQFGRYINARVNPVVSGQTEHEVRSGDMGVTDDEWERFLKNAGRRGTTYQSTRRAALRELLAHDIVYIITDRVGENREYYVKVKTINEVSPDHIGVGEYGDLLSLFVLDDKRAGTASRWHMVDGVCYRDRYTCKPKDRDGSKYWYEWKWELDTSINTGADFMLVQPVVIGDTGYHPQHPESWNLARVCMDYYQQENRHQWLMTLARNPKFETFGDLEGVRGAIGNALVKSGDANNNYPPQSAFIEPSPQNIEQSRKGLQDAMQSIREIASDHGVTINETSAGQSGESKKYDYDATEKGCLETERLARKIDEIVIDAYKKMFNRGYDYIFRYAGSYTPESQVEARDALDILSVMERINAQEAFAEIANELTRRVVGSKLPSARMNEISEEISAQATNMDDTDL